MTQPENSLTLPATPSALIRAATADARSLDRERYVPYSGTWHNPHLQDGDEAVCDVCNAGAVIAARAGLPASSMADPEDFDAPTRRKLLAINQFRAGRVGTAFAILRCTAPAPDRKRNRISGRLVRSAAFVNWKGNYILC